jgi:XapX domain-containing protein
MLGFIAAGFACVALFGWLRLRSPAWPLHPILLVALSTWTVNILAPSILVGWCVRTAVISLGGSRAHRAIRPLMIGIIAGELLSGLGWIVVGAIYHATTGLIPAQFSILQN